MVKEIRQKIFAKHASLAKDNKPLDYVSLEVELNKLKPQDY